MHELILYHYAMCVLCSADFTVSLRQYFVEVRGAPPSLRLPEITIFTFHCGVFPPLLPLRHRLRGGGSALRSIALHTLDW